VMVFHQPMLRLGLRANWQQFSLLILINAFVGAMLGLERTVVPLIATNEFQLASVSVTLSFIISFGVVKAFANLFTGRMADRIGRKPLLVAGWLIGLPVPFLIIAAPTWGWIVVANILLGINQGLCWSTAVIMKIDLVGPQKRGFAMGLNEFAGYLAMALSTVISGSIAAQTALRPYPFYLGIGFACIGLFLSALFVRETIGYARYEAAGRHGQQNSNPPTFGAIFRLVTWQNRTFFSVSQGGLVNNLNDVVIWGLLPLLALQRQIPIDQAAALSATYLAVWGISQLATGAWSDRIGRKPFITGGLWLQSLGIITFALASSPVLWLAATIIMGLGTGMVYPTLLAAISDTAPPLWRASALGVYRLWRDSGYAIGAVLAGICADLVSIDAAIVMIAALTAISGCLTLFLLPETLPNKQKASLETATA
jgi:MFS family permease